MLRLAEWINSMLFNDDCSYVTSICHTRREQFSGWCNSMLLCSSGLEDIGNALPAFELMANEIILIISDYSHTFLDQRARFHRRRFGLWKGFLQNWFKGLLVLFTSENEDYGDGEEYSPFNPPDALRPRCFSAPKAAMILFGSLQKAWQIPTAS